MSLQIELLIPEYDFNTKDIFNTILKYNLFNKLVIKSINDNIFLKEKYTDILAYELNCFDENDDKVLKLKERGYQKTEYENYVNSLVNGCISEKVTSIYKIKKFETSIKINGIKISVSFKDNVVNITRYNPYKLLKSIEYEMNIKNFIIDNSGFVYILFEDNTFIKSHIALNFYKDLSSHSCITKLEDIEKLFSIKFENTIDKILNIEDYYIHFINDKNEVIEAELGRKYYFFKDGNLYYNSLDNKENNTMQIEHQHFYDWVSILGLNNFKSAKDQKISSFFMEQFNKIVQFKFDATLNGMLNYSDFSIDKSYKIDKDIDFVKIQGNFNYGYELGKYKIVLKANKSEDDKEVLFNIDLLKDNICLKRVTGNTVDGVMYFCNLKFNFYKETYDNLITFEIEINDNYSVRISKELVFVDEENPVVDFEHLDKISQFFRRDGIKHQIIETDIEKGYFIIRDYIKNSKERNFNGKDFAIRLIEDDGTPSMLWRQIKDKDYFLKLKNYSVVKTLKPKRDEKKLFTINRKSFKFNLDKITK